MPQDKEKRYEEALQWIHGLGRFGIKPGLERMHALLDLLGNPHHSINFVHIAGTNGKGSTAAILASILKASGYSVGLYTSPYLLSFTNRMAVNGSDIDHAELADLVDLIKPLIDSIVDDPRLGQPTEFEVVTVLALTYFARCKVDLVVLEAGLGGRLDATNVVIPLLSIITNISLEHTEVLGGTIEKIAFEKAGIIKPGVPLLTAAMNEEALAVFEKRSLELNSKLYRVYPPEADIKGQPFPGPTTTALDIVTEGQYFSYKGFERNFDNLFLPLRGRYQLENAATALAAVELLAANGFNCPDEHLRKGVAETIWPGRLELLDQEPMLIMDGAHNPAAMKKLAEAVPYFFNYAKLILVIGILADKDTETMLKSILPLADIVIFTRPMINRAAEPDKVAAFAVKELGFTGDYYVHDQHGAALDQALSLAGPADAVLVTGSLYTVSDIRAYWVQGKAD